jgi:hypothetical protein
VATLMCAVVRVPVRILILTVRIPLDSVTLCNHGFR